MTETGRLRLATFNIKHAAPKLGYRGNSKLLADACVAIDADILALQEVDHFVMRSRLANLAKIAAKATGMQYSFRPTMLFHGGLYGNALLVRGEIEQVKTRWMLGDRRYWLQTHDKRFFPFPERRNFTVATARVDGHEISVANTHLAATRDSVKAAQLMKVREALLALPGPQALLGDLNLPGPEVIEYLKPGMTVAFPGEGIDNIAVNGLTICPGTAETLPFFPISDHRARVVEVAWPPADT